MPIKYPPDPPPLHPPSLLWLQSAADLQDNLLIAANDLDRLERLLADATETLLHHFHAASGHLERAGQAGPGHAIDAAALAETARHLGGAVTALQFQDMSSQLIAHLQRRLRQCTDRLARELMGDDEGDEDLAAINAPLRPNPVTQDEMDAGSVELF